MDEPDERTRENLLHIDSPAINQYKTLVLKLLVNRPFAFRRLFTSRAKSQNEDRSRAQDETLTILASASKPEKRSLVVFLHGLGFIRRTIGLIVLKGADLSGVDFRSTDLSDVDLSGTNLTEAIFDGTLLHGARFAGATLRRARFHDANLIKADFSDSDLAEADMTGADLTRATLFKADFLRSAIEEVRRQPDKHAALGRIRRPTLEKARCTEGNLSRAVLNGSRLSGCDFTGADLTDADLGFVEAVGTLFTKAKLVGTRLDEAKLTQADLSFSNLGGASLKGAVLSHATLVEANLSFANFAGAHASEADLSRVEAVAGDFTNCDLSGVNLSFAVLAGADFRGANLTNAKLNNANLDHADFGGADLTNAVLDQTIQEEKMRISTSMKLRWADLSNASLRQCDFSKATFRGANLTRATLEGSKLTGADFDHAKLVETNLSSTNLAGASFRGAIFHLTNVTNAKGGALALAAEQLEGTQLYSDPLSWSTPGLTIAVPSQAVTAMSEFVHTFVISPNQPPSILVKPLDWNDGAVEIPDLDDFGQLKGWSVKAITAAILSFDCAVDEGLLAFRRFHFLLCTRTSNTLASMLRNGMPALSGTTQSPVVFTLRLGPHYARHSYKLHIPVQQLSGVEDLDAATGHALLKLDELYESLPRTYLGLGNLLVPFIYGTLHFGPDRTRQIVFSRGQLIAYRIEGGRVYREDLMS